MALAVSVALDADNVTPGVDPVVTATFNSSADSIVFIFISLNNTRTVTSVTRDGVTYTEEIFELIGGRNTYVYRGVHSGAVTTEAISIDLNNPSDPTWFLVWEVTGIDTGGTNGSDGVIHSDFATATATAPSTVTGTLPAFADGANRPMAMGLLNKNEGNDHWAVETGYTEVDEETVSNALTWLISWHESATDISPSATAQNYSGSRPIWLYCMEMQEPSGASLSIDDTDTVTVAESINPMLVNMPKPTESVTVAEAINPNVLLMPQVET